MTTNIATTREQSARLQQCGVDPKTADMCWDKVSAWSLPALLALLPEMIEGGYWLTIQKCKTGPSAPVFYGIAYFKCEWDNPEDISTSTITTEGRLKYFKDRNLIEAVCNMIEWLTANNYKLNKL